jgi:hypothetical protein
MKSTTSGSYTFKLLQGLIKSEKFIGSIGVVAMEFADEYRTLYSFEISKYDYPKDVKAAAMYLILELAIKTGYSHADFHGGNIMILKEKSGKDLNYFNYNEPSPTLKNGVPVKNIYTKGIPPSTGFKGKPLLIDFGLAVKIPEDILKQVIRLYEKGHYISALRLISTVPRRDGYRIDTPDWSRNYGWVWDYGFTSDKDKEKIKEMVKSIKELIDARENAKKIVKEKFNKEHPSEPQLPLTDDGKMKILQDNSLDENMTGDDMNEKDPNKELSADTYADVDLSSDNSES